MHWFSFSPREEQQIMFKRLSTFSNSGYLVLVQKHENIHWALLLATPLVFFTPANMQNMPLWSQVLSSQSGHWVLSSGTGAWVLFRVNLISKRQLPRQTSHPTSNPDNKVTSNPSKLLITSLPQKDVWRARSPQKLCIWISRFCQSCIEMLSCGANMGNISSNLACNQ